MQFQGIFIYKIDKLIQFLISILLVLQLLLIWFLACAIMNSLDMPVHIFICDKWLVANVTLVVSLIFIMHPFDVVFQLICFSKWLFTKFTLVIFLAIMNCMNVSLQISCYRKRSGARFTFVFFVSFVNCVSVLL